MINLAPIQDWKTVFVDTSFIINCLADLSRLKSDTLIYDNVKRAKALIEYFSLETTLR